MEVTRIKKTVVCDWPQEGNHLVCGSLNGVIGDDFSFDSRLEVYSLQDDNPKLEKVCSIKMSQEVIKRPFEQNGQFFVHVPVIPEKMERVRIPMKRKPEMKEGPLEFDLSGLKDFEASLLKKLQSMFNKVFYGSKNEKLKRYEIKTKIEILNLYKKIQRNLVENELLQAINHCLTFVAQLDDTNFKKTLRGIAKNHSKQTRSYSLYLKMVCNQYMMS